MNKKKVINFVAILFIIIVIILITNSYFNKGVTGEITVQAQKVDKSFSDKFLDGLRGFFERIAQSPPGPNCGFINLPNDGSQVILSEHIFYSPRAKCDCNIDNVRNILVNGEGLSEEEIKFEFPLSASDGQEGTEVLVAPLRFLFASDNIWQDRQQHRIDAEIVCDDRKSVEVSARFVTVHQKEEQFDSLDEGLMGESIGNFEGSEGQQEALASSCKSFALASIPYFDEYGQEIGFVPAADKIQFYDNLLKPGAETILSDSIQSVPNGAGFSNLVIAPNPSHALDNWLAPDGALDWNDKGLAPLFYQNGSYFGIAVPHPAMVTTGNPQAALAKAKFFAYLQEIKSNHRDKLPVFLFDEFIVKDTPSNPGESWQPNPSTTNVIAAYNGDWGIIIADSTVTENFKDFEYQGPSGWDTTEEKITKALAHELGHSFKLGHNTVSGNLMHPTNEGIESQLPASAACMLRRQCNSLQLQMNGQYYALHVTVAPAGTCGNEFLDKLTMGPNSGLDETCDVDFADLDVKFDINCELDNPGINYEFNGEWGAEGRKTPFWCYKELPNDYQSTNPDNPTYDPNNNFANQCKDVDFCGENGEGDGYFNIGVEECDPSVPGKGNALCQEEFGENFKCGDPENNKFCFCVEEPTRGVCVEEGKCVEIPCDPKTQDCADECSEGEGGACDGVHFVCIEEMCTEIPGDGIDDCSACEVTCEDDSDCGEGQICGDGICIDDDGDDGDDDCLAPDCEDDLPVDTNTCDDANHDDIGCLLGNGEIKCCVGGAFVCLNQDDYPEGCPVEP